MTKYSSLTLFTTFLAMSSAFQVRSPVPSNTRAGVSEQAQSYQRQRQFSSLQMSSTKEDKKKTKGPFDERLRTKLVSESIAPWRNLRLFLYGSLGSGAAVGGFITLAGTAAALSGARTDIDLNTEVGDLILPMEVHIISFIMNVSNYFFSNLVPLFSHPRPNSI
jgi:Low psii accumulation1 / Rep27